MARHSLSSAFSPALRRLFPDGPSRRRVRPCLEALEDRITPTTFTPTVLTDGVTGNPNGTLRDAISAANADTGTATDTIQLQAGTYTLSIDNSGKQHEQANASGDLNITSTKHALVIQGATDAQGNPATFIEQKATDRVFQIVNPGTTVTFKDLIIEDGQAQDDGSAGAAAGSATAEGGGILDNGGNVTLTNVVLQNNLAVAGIGFFADGGGIFAGNGGSLTVRSSVFQTNSALGGPGRASGPGGGFADGGGICALGPTTIIDSTFSGNVVTGGNGNTNGGNGGFASGGGIQADDPLTITDSTLSSNIVTGGNASNGGDGGFASGGGIQADDSLTITDSTVSGNVVTGGTGNLSGLVVEHFTGDVGGDAEGGSVTADGTTIITASTLSGNTLTGGDGTYSSGTVEGTIGGSAAGGGLYFSSPIGTESNTITASSLSGNTVTGGNTGGGSDDPGTAKGGGASFVSNSTALVNVTIADNQVFVEDTPAKPVAGGGGLYFGGTATATLTNVTVADNKASLSQGSPVNTFGGGIDNDGGTVTLVNTLVALNNAVTGTDYNGAVSNSDHNLIGEADGSSGFSASHGDLLGSSANPLNPLLGLLADNGGPTPTIALLPGSPALHAGDASIQSVTESFDQRGQGFARVVNGTIDIGAFEVQPPLSSSPSPKQPPALHTPFLLALFDELLHGIETVNGNDTETVIDGLFGLSLLVSTYDSAGNLESVTLFGTNITALFELS